VPRQFLHAARLDLRHPISGEAMALEAPLPPDLQAVVDWVTEDMDL
jgi:23S rRNA pseudouridine955/2504/2580 synthase